VRLGDRDIFVIYGVILFDFVIYGVILLEMLKIIDYQRFSLIFEGNRL